MFAAKALARAVPQSRNILASRNMTTVSSAPMNKVSFTEILAHGAIMTVGFLAVPTWVLLHIREYKGHN